MAKKTRVEDIDSEFIINSFRQDDLSIPPAARSVEGMPAAPAAPAPPPTADDAPPASGAERREDARRRNTGAPDYESQFLKEVETPARYGKPVYVSKEFHERIRLLLSVVCKDKVSMFSFVNNVLAHHFEKYQEEITRLYHEHSKSIF